jgi:predicted dehydrogenase
MSSQSADASVQAPGSLVEKLGAAIYGLNGHQIHKALLDHPRATLIAVAGVEPSRLPPAILENPAIRRYATLDELLCDVDVQFVSLCSPRRADQARDALRCLDAGRHVYAEKPCALAEDQLDQILERAARGPALFREMAGTAFDEPYLTMAEVIRAGRIGEIIQVFVQKSYPFYDARPSDEDTDGGLIRWVGVHALRYIEHITGIRIADISAAETTLGNCGKGDLRMAASFIMRLENGAVGTAICNYLNPKGFGSWGNEHVRLFGTKGMVEAVDAGHRTRLVIGDKDWGPLECRHKPRPYHDLFIDSILGLGQMPFDLETELHPTRMAIRAKDKARRVY